ncbi:MAG TPA: feruloyl-CoA synthase [Terriglobales bacterium]
MSVLNQLQNARWRPVRFFSPEVELTREADGTFRMRCLEPLDACDERIGDWLDRWAARAPGRLFLVEQTPAGERAVTYREARDEVLALAEGLLEHDLGPEHPLAILAPNSIDHALVMLAALYVGIPISPMAPAYALQSRDYAKLTHNFRVLTPGMVVVEEGELYRTAIASSLAAEIPVVALRNPAPGMAPLASLRRTRAQWDRVMQAASRVGPQTVAKYLFTSGSTSMPKAVINTHGMLCANSQMKRQIAPFLMDEPPIMVDWAPWNHTAGGNSNFHIILHNGGTLYIDPGKPTPALFPPSLELLRRVSPTLYFNVPRGYELLVPHLEADMEFSRHFFRDIKFLWYAAASLQAATWFDLDRLALAAVGERILTVSGLGMTETSPIALFGNHQATGPGVIGIPVPGMELKLVPHEDSFEVRYRGPNVTPAYWRNEAATRAVFDEDGFFRSGDLLSFVDPSQPRAGLRFDGRASEEFKLSSGTKVSAGKLRLAALDALRPLAGEVVVVGPDRPDVRLLLFPDWEQCALAAGLEAGADPGQIASSRRLRATLLERLGRLAATGTGSSNRVVAAVLVEVPPSGPAGELTEKGTVNSRAFQRNRPELLDLVYDERDERVLRVPQNPPQD